MSVPVVAMIHYYRPDSPRRGFYSSASSNDYVTYISKGIDAGKGADRDYMTYMGNPDKSTGVFDENGILDSERKKALREQLRNAKGNIWDPVISTDEALGKGKLSSYDQAYSLLRDAMRIIAELWQNPEIRKEIKEYAKAHPYHRQTEMNNVHLVKAKSRNQEAEM